MTNHNHLTNSSWRRRVEGIGDWSAWLAQGDEPGELEILRRNADTENWND